MKKSLKLMFDYGSSCLWIGKKRSDKFGPMLDLEESRIPLRIQKKVLKYNEMLESLYVKYFIEYGRFTKTSFLLQKQMVNSNDYKIAEKLQNEIMVDLYRLYCRRLQLYYFDEKKNAIKKFPLKRRIN